jgi:RNA polymerase sigma-70 factor (ECF subfamily)
MEPASPQLIGWVGRHILPLEARLRSWLRSAFPTIDADDVIQETYCRISALDSVAHIADPRSYFFQTARNVVLQQIRRTRVVSIEAASGLSEFDQALAEDDASPERIVAGRRALARVEALIAALPDRCRQIFQLRKIEGVSQREIATRLGVTETIVENEVTRGLRRILDAMGEEERAEMRGRAGWRGSKGRDSKDRDSKGRRG